jgi:hypothetical protein
MFPVELKGAERSGWPQEFHKSDRAFLIKNPSLRIYTLSDHLNILEEI